MTTTEQARNLATIFDLLPAITWTGHRGDDYACILAPGQTTEDATIHLYDVSDERVVAIADVLSHSRAAAAALRELSDQVERLTGERLDAPFHVSRSSDGKRHWFSVRDAASGVSIPARDREDAEALAESLNGAVAVQIHAATFELTKERDALREALTPSADTKYAYIGEFSFTIEMFNPEDDDWQPQRVTVPWDTTKEIMAAIAARAALNAGGERG